MACFPAALAVLVIVLGQGGGLQRETGQLLAATEWLEDRCVLCLEFGLHDQLVYSVKHAWLGREARQLTAAAERLQDRCGQHVW